MRALMHFPLLLMRHMSAASVERWAPISNATSISSTTKSLAVVLSAFHTAQGVWLSHPVVQRVSVPVSLQAGSSRSRLLPVGAMRHWLVMQ